MTKNIYRLCLVGIFLISLALRFWGLDRFNTLVFDEVYYAKYGNDYLTHTQFFDAHPPLGKYMIAIGIWLSSHFPFWQESVNGLTGSLRSPWSYRWMNALSGSFIPLIIANIAYQLSYRRSFAVLSGLFAALDGIFIVESRYALINIYIVLFGLLGQFLFLLALSQKQKTRLVYLGLAGVALGASCATKWNGVFFLVGIYAIWGFAWIYELITHKHELAKIIINLLEFSINNSSHQKESHISPLLPIQKLTQINIGQCILFLGIIPLSVYSLIWIPHLQINNQFGFIAVHEQIFAFHKELSGNSPTVHPYCAAWYKWPLLTRPMAYYYQTAHRITDPLPVFGPPLPANAGGVVYDVHALGNPFLWWFGAVAILFLLLMLVAPIVIPILKQRRLLLPENLSVETWVALYLVLNYFVNLLPWVRVTRCVFIYHYMTGVVFAFLAIAWFVNQCLYSYHRSLRVVGVTISFMIIAAFVFWLPIYLGLPISPEGYRMRMWFNSWI
ncbi:dolichyl-phosphate-mannose--protein O-mannosyl transferase [Nostoc sp. CENA543]|uniref:dolichyl-phosphate-mannose--protein mannosyltransferase n=1 Tax=Nostoc sp. CENA543 TaxID=1869241 RepID=UPI000CA0E2EF|nr:phospholipid carrier-dependent glycosyltransferase [Nostoc sp. CENA543]AUT00678.1 dolichyl-phosphate-mannose--protein O-mannosyl transferase [Nostoc sp. CENA543]